MKTLKEAEHYIDTLTPGDVDLYLVNSSLENEKLNIMPYYDKEEQCIALPFAVTLGKVAVVCKIKLPRDVIMECINDKHSGGN